MIGLFSFREKTVQEMVHFWMKFLDRIGIKPDYVTIHPDRIDEWSLYYIDYDVLIKTDEECKWSDGEIGGYCTEFYKDNIEIGNIVNPLGNCIDVGFGLERLEIVLTGIQKSKEETLKESVLKIIGSGFTPSNVKQGYVLRKLLRICHKDNIVISHQFFIDEVKRQEKIIIRYNRLKEKNKDKSKEWWYDTHGIDLDNIKL
jgi:alanyl-tRNA synthetase